MRRPLPRLLLLSIVSLVGAAVACGGCAHPAAGPPAAQTDPGNIQLQLLALNDFHGQLEPPDGKGAEVLVAQLPDGGFHTEVAGGLAHLAALIAHLRGQAPNTLVLSAGDLVGASPLSSALFHDEPTIEAMNRLGLALHAVGNHEFDDGVAELERLKNGGCGPPQSCALQRFEGARFPFLAANVFTADGETLFQPYVIEEVEGVKVGFIGVTLEGTPTIVARKHVGGLTFRDEVETVNALVPRLRAQGVEALILVIHEGAEHEGTINACGEVLGPVMAIAQGIDPAVDAIISGHSHAAYNCLVQGRRVTSALSAGRVITRLQLELDRTSGDVVSVRAENLPVLRDRSDPQMQALVDRYVAEAAPLENRVVGALTGPLIAPRHGTSPSGESSLGNVVADAFLQATRAPDDGGAQLALVNPGGLRADLGAGEVTYGMAFATSPFGNALITVTLNGAQLLEALEAQWQPNKQRILGTSANVRYAWSESAALGSRVVPGSLTIDGVPVRPETRYRVAINSFLSTGGDGFSVFTRGTEPVGGPQDLEALVQFLQAHRPLHPPALDRVRKLERVRTNKR